MAAPLYAALAPGVQAPDFTTQATLAGKPFKFSLAAALKTGPVRRCSRAQTSHYLVLYLVIC